jgi:hypothetical protein
VKLLHGIICLHIKKYNFANLCRREYIVFGFCVKFRPREIKWCHSISDIMLNAKWWTAIRLIAFLITFVGWLWCELKSWWRFWGKFWNFIRVTLVLLIFLLVLCSGLGADQWVITHFAGQCHELPFLLCACRVGGWIGIMPRQHWRSLEPDLKIIKLKHLIGWNGDQSQYYNLGAWFNQLVANMPLTVQWKSLT